MPGILTTTEEFDLWLEGETVESLKLQQPLPDGMLDIVARGEKEDPPVEAERWGGEPSSTTRPGSGPWPQKTPTPQFSAKALTKFRQARQDESHAAMTSSGTALRSDASPLGRT